MPPNNLDHRGNDREGEDTIVVKSDNYWAHPSSPESSPEPEIEPLVANLLAQINNTHNQELESPEPEEQDERIPTNSSTGLDQITQPSPYPVARPGRNTSTGTSEERLLQLPELRPLPWRDGVDPTSENEVGGDSRRKQIRFGCLLATRGQVQEVPCATCANGRGKFSLCVALPGFFKGACASCQLSGGPNRCTIKKNDDELPDSSNNTPHEKSRQSLGNTKRTPSSDTPKPRAKRRRMTTDKVEKAPELASARLQWQQEIGDSQARQPMSQIVQSPWATVNQPNPLPVPKPPPMMMNVLDGGRNNLQYVHDRRGSAGWATVNQPAPPPPPPPPPRGHHNGVNTGGYQSNGVDYQGNGVGHQITVEQTARDDSVPNDEKSVALIDTLPKHKQRQLYGLVSGLQGGIKHLQTELDSLKKALGMDV